MHAGSGIRQDHDQRYPSENLYAIFLVALAATPYSGSYWLLIGLSVLVVADVARAGRPLHVSRSIVAVLAWWALSVTWSVAPSLTVRNGLLIGLVTVATSVMTSVLGLAGSLRALMMAFRLVLTVSWALYLGWPSVGRTLGAYQGGTFEGLFIQRNVAAFVCVISAITFACAAVAKLPGVRPSRSYGWTIVSVVTLLATASGTGLAVLLAVGGTLALLLISSRAESARRRRFFVLCAITPVVGLALWLPYNLGVVSKLFGRDETLTGRSVIWAVVESAVTRSPLEGYGYGALWTPGVSLTERLWAQGGFNFYHAHSAYWDYLLQTGIIGLLLITGMLVIAVWRSCRLMISGGGVAAAWPLSIVVCLLIYAVDEQSFASHFGWVLAVMALTISSRWTSFGVAEQAIDLPGCGPSVSSKSPYR